MTAKKRQIGNQTESHSLLAMPRILVLLKTSCSIHK